ncbi:MAG: HNH endonuclease [Acidimicrobiia bacterium]|nr:HNH endonuclease [Acidimicrobiia bacterium]
MTKAASHREEVFVDHLDGLVDAARGLAPERYRHVIRRWAVLADDLYDRGEPEPGRWLRTTVTFAGAVRVDGILDPAGGAVLVAALDARSRPDGPGDPRSPIERRADALVALAAGDERPTVNLDVLVDVHTLEGRPPTDPAAVRCDLTGVGPIGPDLIGLLACDANIARVLTRGPSEILDLGRRTRIVTPAQRRALAIRDGGCVFPGCTRPEPWCDTHHIIHWLHGGPGDLDNMALVCRAHHTAVHQGRWALTRTPTAPSPPPEPPPPTHGPAPEPAQDHPSPTPATPVSPPPLNEAEHTRDAAREIRRRARAPSRGARRGTARARPARAASRRATSTPWGRSRESSVYTGTSRAEARARRRQGQVDVPRPRAGRGPGCGRTWATLTVSAGRWSRRATSAMRQLGPLGLAASESPSPSRRRAPERRGTHAWRRSRPDCTPRGSRRRRSGIGSREEVVDLGRARSLAR